MTGPTRRPAAGGSTVRGLILRLNFSCGRLIALVAIFQLIQSGGLTLGHKLQDILALKTPAEGPPVDASS
jgi:hypothetical protein